MTFEEFNCVEKKIDLAFVDLICFLLAWKKKHGTVEMQKRSALSMSGLEYVE